MKIDRSEKNKEKQRLLELFSNAKELSNLIPNVIREKYPQFSEELDGSIDLLTKNVANYISNEQLDSLADGIIEDRNNFFTILKSKIESMPKNTFLQSSQYGFLPACAKIDLTQQGYMSYDNPFGLIAYSKSVNHPSYTLNKDADKLFCKMLDKGIFDSKKTDINILFAGIGILENAWANEINKRNNSKNDNITIVDSSSSAALFRKLFLDKNINSYQKQIDLDEMCDYIQSRMRDDRKCIIIKHNGMACDNIDDNYREMLLLKSATKFKDATFFYTLPTITNLTTQNAYVSSNPNLIPFAYSTLKELLNIKESDFSKFEPFVNTRLINGEHSITYEIGFKTKENIEVHNNGSVAVIPEGKILLLQRSNRYSYSSINGFENIFGTGSRLKYCLELDSNKSFVALY